MSRQRRRRRASASAALLVISLGSAACGGEELVVLGPVNVPRPPPPSPVHAAKAGDLAAAPLPPTEGGKASFEAVAAWLTSELPGDSRALCYLREDPDTPPLDQELEVKMTVSAVSISRCTLGLHAAWSVGDGKPIQSRDVRLPLRAGARLTRFLSVAADDVQLACDGGRPSRLDPSCIENAPGTVGALVCVRAAVPAKDVAAALDYLGRVCSLQMEPD